MVLDNGSQSGLVIDRRNPSGELSLALTSGEEVISVVVVDAATVADAAAVVDSTSDVGSAAGVSVAAEVSVEVAAEVESEVVEAEWEADSKRVYDTIHSSPHPLLLPPSPLLLLLLLLLRGHVLVR